MTEILTEDDLEEAVRDLASLYGVWRYHPHDSRRSQAGWVDDTLLGPGGALFAELKSQDGRRSREQVQVGYLLQAAGLTYRLWRPSDLHSGLIAAELQAISRIPTAP